MKNWKLIFMILGIMCCQISAFAYVSTNDLTIAQIEIESDQDVDKLRALEVIGIKPGDLYRPARFSEALARLAETTKYNNVSGVYNLETRVLKFVLRSSMVLSQVEIILSGGTDLFRTNLEELKSDLIGVTGVAQGDVLYVDILGEVRNRIRKRLFDRGYENPRVVISIEERSGSQRKLLISVNLGMRSGLNQLVLKNFRPNDIAELVKTLKIQFESRGFQNDFELARNILQDLINKPIELVKQFQKKGIVEDTVELKNPVPMDWVSITEALTFLSSAARSKKYYDYQLKAKPIPLGQGLYGIEFSLNRGKKYRIDVVGTTVYWERDLKNRILDRPQRLGIPFSVPDSEKLLKALYSQKGYSGASVETKIVEDDETKNIEFQVKEGIPYYLGKIRTVGTDESSERIVRDSLNRWLKPLTSGFGKAYLDEELLRSRIPELVQEIRSQGFLQARILELRFDPLEKKSVVGMEISFQVGPRFRFREIEVTGDIVLSDSELNDVLNIEPGDPADPYKVVGSAKKLLETYRNLGFLNVQIPVTERELLKIDYENNLVDVVYDLRPGAQILVGEMRLQGNSKTDDVVVLRELKNAGIEKGKPWSPEGLRKSEQLLSQLGLFNTVKFEPVGGKVLSQNTGEKLSLDLQEKDLRITVTETSPGSIEFGPGYRTDLGMVGFAELNYRNIGGTNKGLNLRAQASRKILNYQFLEQKYSAAFLEPYLFGMNLRFRTSLGFIKEDQTVFVDNVAVSGFNSDEMSLGFAIDKSFSDEVRLTHRLYEISRPRIYDIVDRDNFEPDTESYKIGSFGTSLYYDSRNNFFNPSRGWFVASSYDISPRFLGTDSDASYISLKQTLNRYFSIGMDGTVVATSLSYSHIWGLGDTGGIPENKRLVLGGRTSIRSLAEQSVRFDDVGLVEQNSIEAKIELRQPVVFDFGVAFFFDVGEVRALKYLDSRPSERSGTQSALGFGIRYATAVGPLSLDFAVNPNSTDVTQPFRVQFSIGSF